jgi:hypothetical protein
LKAPQNGESLIKNIAETVALRGIFLPLATLYPTDKYWPKKPIKRQAASGHESHVFKFSFQA